MKLPSLLLATVAAVSAQAEITTGILFCQARISRANDGDLSVALPATPGCVDANGNPATLWRIGNVVVGGATDSFFSENGPGAFSARNNGSTAAYLYVTSGHWVTSYGESVETDKHRYSSEVNPQPTFGSYLGETFRTLFGDEGWDEGMCVPTERMMAGSPFENIRLAVSTAVTSKVPVWRPLSWVYDGNEWVDAAQDDQAYGDPCGQYLGFLLPGEVQLFDLKFWAPISVYQEGRMLVFPVFIEASTFRRWGHDK